jgi:hypothetical protein
MVTMWNICVVTRPALTFACQMPRDGAGARTTERQEGAA